MEQEILRDLENGKPVNIFDKDKREFVKFMLNRETKGNFYKQMVSENKFKTYRCMESDLTLKDVSVIVTNMKRKTILPTNNN